MPNNSFAFNHFSNSALNQISHSKQFHYVQIAIFFKYIYLRKSVTKLKILFACNMCLFVLLVNEHFVGISNFSINSSKFKIDLREIRTFDHDTG